MTTELDLVRTFMEAETAPPGDLLVARAIFESAVSAEVRDDRPLGVASPKRTARRTRRMARWSVAAAVIAVIFAVLILQLTPTSTRPVSEAAAAVISRLADDAQPVPPLLSGQWYQYQLHGLLSAEVYEVNKTPTPNAKASIPFTSGSWSNATSVCNSQQYGTATFASPVNAQAWQAIGLSTAPGSQPTTDCASRVVASIETGGSSLATTDVSNITHNPATLATQLQQGATGIQSLDHDPYPLQGDPANVAAFIRLSILLVGPTTGQWSGFGQEILKTMSLLPGVTSLGEATSHSGVQGLAFSATNVGKAPSPNILSGYITPPTIILDLSTGTVIEARNMILPRVDQSAEQAFVSSASAPLVTEGVTYGATAQWVDPVAALSVTQQDDLPTWISNIHIIKAVTKPSVTEPQAEALLKNQPFTGGDSASITDGFTDENTPASGRTTFYFTVKDSAAYEAVVSALKASALFASITATL